MPKKKENILHLLTAEGDITERAGKDFIPWESAYPRPHMKRDKWLNLNGRWDFCATPPIIEGGMDHRYIDHSAPCDETILVPFPPESRLSGICRDMGRHPRLLYRRTFTLPDGFLQAGERLLLHLGAVDQYAEVFLNGYLQPSTEEGSRSLGAYTPLTYDITASLHPDGPNTLEITAEDDLEEERIPYGKQSLQRGGMWYTPVSGIWQTVWLETVPEAYIKDLRITTKNSVVTVTVVMADEEEPAEGHVEVDLPTGRTAYPLKSGTAAFTVEAPRLWSPEDPYLYGLTVTVGEDTVTSYFALRTLEIKTVSGVPRLCLNGSPYFFHGLLDQGYFSDGIFTPADEGGFERDILAVKSLGFNTLRKHIKIEPEQFYYDCDRLGMIVFQDMVNNGHYAFARDTALPTVGLKKLSDQRLHKDAATRRAFEEAMTQTVARLSFHPCVCYWTIFNEGWGQFDSQKMYEKLKSLDDTRFADTASGWFKGADSDVDSEHVYFKPVRLKYSDKPMVLSEFGGYAWQIKDHAANPDHTYGYRTFKDGKTFEDALVKLYEEEILPAIPKGLCAAIYTQVSDVEDETNGLLTYDRRVLKVSAEWMQRLAGALARAVAPKTDGR